MADWTIGESDGRVTFAVRVIPRAARDAIAGLQGRALKVRLTAPPVNGAANAALIRFLARQLGVRRSAVSIVAGERHRDKTVRVAGLSRRQVERLLAETRAE